MHIKQRTIKRDNVMSHSIVPQHAECMTLTPAEWDDLFSPNSQVRSSIESGHLVYDKDNEVYYPAIDEIFETTFNATNAMSKHATVVCSGVMTVYLTPEQKADVSTLAKTMDILSYANDDDTAYSGSFADVRVHMPIPRAY